MTDDECKAVAELNNCAPDLDGDGARLSDWEIAFLESIAKWQGKLTPPQKAKLADIWEKCFG